MITLELNKMTKAIERAKAIRPRVKWLGGRKFEVIGSTGARYRVSFTVADGFRFAECDCRAGKAKMICFHVAAAAQVNIIVQSARRQALAA